MRVIKGIVLFCFCTLFVSACFDPPEFSTTPHIEFRGIKFRDPGTANQELILEIDFRDGDGDLGLSSIADTEFPYHSEYYYLHDGLGDTIPIIAQRYIDSDGIIYTILNAQDLPGKIVTSKTRTLPNYGHLPAYDPNFSCLNYKTVTTIIIEDDIIPGVLVPLSSIDASYEIQDTLLIAGGNYALIKDLLYYRNNPNAYNIEVRFWQFVSGSYVEYDWYKFNDCQNFFGQFETSASSNYPKRPIEGTLQYRMANSSFKSTFGSRKIRVSVRIRDRALNVSNTVQSPIFELSEIRVD